MEEIRKSNNQHVDLSFQSRTISIKDNGIAQLNIESEKLLISFERPYFHPYGNV